MRKAQELNMAKSKAKPRPVAKSAATSKASTLNKTRSKISATQTIPPGGGGSGGKPGGVAR